MDGQTRGGSGSETDADAHILLVEDDPDDVRVILRLLDQAPISFRVTVMEHGRKALDWLNTVGRIDDPRTPDLIILDINMPVMNGMVFLSELRRHPVFRSLPVVTLTTSTDVDTIRRAYDFGANAVVNKADSLDGMSQIVNTTVEFWFRIAHRYYID